MNARDGAQLPEIPEAEAAGELADIYQDIRVQLRVPLVNLIYRHMASAPGFLRWAWASVRPAIVAGSVTGAAARLADSVDEHPPAVISRVALRALRVSEADHVDVLRILAAYNRANPCNLLIVSILLRLLEGDAGDAPAPPLAAAPEPGAVPAPVGPDMIDPGEMAPATAALVASLPREPTIVPSLYRHLANWPELLATLSVLLEPVRARMEAPVEVMRRAAARVADDLVTTPGAVPRYELPRADGPVTVSTLGAFVPTICTMVVVGKVFRRMLPDAA